VLAVVSDTHASDSHRLEGRTREAVRTADRVVHAGDFTTAAVLEAFETVADDLAAVHGNNDDPAVRRRLPAERVVTYRGARVAVAHGHEHDGTTLPLFGREREADLVVVGHSHRPAFEEVGGVPVLDPGSHADPRWNRPGHAELEVDDGGIEGRILKPDGTLIEAFHVEKERRTDR
jgi:putative phosphoesterase